MGLSLDLTGPFETLAGSLLRMRLFLLQPTHPEERRSGVSKGPVHPTYPACFLMVTSERTGSDIRQVSA